jgi:RHS repeat-associated protein
MKGHSGRWARVFRSAATTCALAILSLLCFPDTAKASASFPSYAAANAYCLTVIGVLTGHGTFYGGCINYPPVPPYNTGVVRLNGSFGGYAFDYDTPANAPWPGKTAGPNCNCAGDPITLSTGNEFHDELDADLGALSLHRYYNSDMGITSANIGSNWRHSFDRSLSYTTEGGTSATLYRDNGSIVIFRLKDGAWTVDPDVQDKLVSTASGWTYFEAATRQHETYDMSGYLTSIVDVNGLVTSMTYSTADTPTSVAPYANLLLTVTDAHGRTLSFTYVPGLYAWSSRLSTVTLPDGGVISYSYADDSATQVSNLGQVTYPDGSKKTYQYTMNQGDIPWPNALTGVVDEKGVLYTEISYDNQGRATGSHLAGGADATSIVYNTDGTTSVTYPLGVTTTLNFAVMNYDTRTTGVSSPCGAACQQPNAAATYDSTGHTTSTTDFNGNVRGTTFDANGLLTEEIAASGTSAQRTTDTTWDTSLRQPLTRTAKDNTGKLVSTEGWAYNATGQTTAQCLIDPVVAPSYTCAPNGAAPTGVRRTTTTYCTVVDGSACPLVGLPLTVDGPRTDVTDTVSYAWYPTTDESGCGTVGGSCHHLGDLKSSTDGAGLVTTYVSYDKAGRVTRVKDPNGVLTDFTYTPRGWLASKTVRANISGAASSSDAVTTVLYDPTGTVHSMTDPDGVKVAYTYDAAHRLTDITDASGNHIHYTLDAAGNRTSSQVLTSTGTVVRSKGRTFNALGQLTAMTDGLNRTVFSASFSDSYDANGNLVRSQDGLGHQTKQAFDGLNRLASTLQNYQGTDTATANSQTVNTFDALDRVGGFSDPDGLNTAYDIDAFGNSTALHSPDTGTTSHTFDVAGNALTSVDATNNSRSRTYDADNRLLTETFADTSLNVQYKYDEADTVTGCTGSFGKGHLTRVIEGNGGIVWCYDNRGNVVTKQQTVGTVTRTTTYAWTNGNRLASVTTPNGTSIAYTRNALGQIASIQATPSGGAATMVVSNVVHMPFGPVASYTLGDGQNVSLTYDANGAWTDVASTAFSLHVKRDVVGNIVAVGNAAGVPTPTETYSYDPLYRLTGVNAADGSAIEAYTYNKTGDRLSKTAPGLLTGNYNYAAGTHHLTGVGTTTRVVDARGNTTADVLASGTFGYGYNGRNRLTVIQNGGVTAGGYVLNALGQRVQKTANGVTTRFDYDEDGRLLSEIAGTTTRDYIWMDSLPVGIVDHAETTSSVNFVRADGLGSPRAVTSSAGTVLWQWAYASNPFGEKAPVSSAGYTLNLRFPGQYYDAESGLNYNVNRDYEPATGRYIQSDRMGIAVAPSTYSYVGGSPLTAVDPLGLCDEDDRCRKVKADGIVECSATFPNGKLNQSFFFFNCLNAYIEEHGCGPGGRPLPQPDESPAPAPAEQDSNAGRRALGWGLGAAVLYGLGALLFSTP